MRSVVVFEHLTLWDRDIAGVALGSGRRLFDTGARAALRLVDAKASPSGVVITAYQESG
jgi:hypothetical protein